MFVCLFETFIWVVGFKSSHVISISAHALWEFLANRTKANRGFPALSTMTIFPAHARGCPLLTRSFIQWLLTHVIGSGLIIKEYMGRLSEPCGRV